jgi:hypothetical protein
LKTEIRIKMKIRIRKRIKSKIEIKIRTLQRTLRSPNPDLARDLAPAFRWLAVVITYGPLLVVAAGCGTPNSRVPAVGIVTLDGAPVEGATVAFFPDVNSPGQGGFAKAGPDGRFEIAYPGTGTGLVPGTYRVTVTKPPGNMPRKSEDDTLIDAPIRSGGGIPGRYANPENTPLRVTVEPGGRPAEIKPESDRKSRR